MFEVIQSSKHVKETIKNEFKLTGMEPVEETIKNKLQHIGIESYSNFHFLSNKVKALQLFLLSGNEDCSQKKVNLQERIKELGEELVTLYQDQKQEVDALTKEIESEKSKAKGLLYFSATKLSKFRIERLNKAEEEYRTQFQNFISYF